MNLTEQALAVGMSMTDIFLKLFFVLQAASSTHCLGHEIHSF
jgi:hypothetical protein